MKTKVLMLPVTVFGSMALPGMSAQAQYNRQCPEKMIKDFLAEMKKLPRDCTGQLRPGTFAYITGVRPRRLVVADVQKGIAAGISMVYHACNLKMVKINGVPGVIEIPAFN